MRILMALRFEFVHLLQHESRVRAEAVHFDNIESCIVWVAGCVFFLGFRDRIGLYLTARLMDISISLLE